MNKKRKFALLALVACISFSLFGCAQRNEKKATKKTNKITYNEVKDLNSIKNINWFTRTIKISKNEIKDFKKIKWNKTHKLGLFINNSDLLCISSVTNANKAIYTRYYKLKKDEKNTYKLTQNMLVASSSYLKKKNSDTSQFEKMDINSIHFANKKDNYYKIEDENKKFDSNIKFYISSNKKVLVSATKLKNGNFKYTKFVKIKNKK